MSLLGNILAGKRVIQAGERVIRESEGSIATSQRQGKVRASQYF